MDLERAEHIKLNFDQNHKFANEEDISIEILQKIILARTEEILELCNKSAEFNSFMLGEFKMVLMGEGAKILDNQYKDKIAFSNDIDLLDESNEDIIQSAHKLNSGGNKQEVVTIPKKQINKGFFEKLFHLFR